MDSLRVLCNFKLDTLDEDWIRSVWDAEFVAYKQPPDAYLKYLESNSAKSLLRTSCQNLKQWITANLEQLYESEKTEFSWQQLRMLDINVEGILAVLDYVMKTGQRVGIDEASRQACLEATSLYLMFLTVPGSNAFRVYHPNLYKRVMDTLKLSRNIFSSKQNSSKKTDDNCSNDNNHYVLSYFEKLKIVRKTKDIVFDLITMLQSFRLNGHRESLQVTIHTLLDITRLEMYAKLHDTDKHLEYMVSLLSKAAFQALEALCNSNHGPINLTVMLIVQYMLSYLIASNTDSHTNSYYARSMTAIQESFICFLGDLLKHDTKEAAQAVVTLIHQLMVNCPERLDGRQKQAVTLIKLLNICNENIVQMILQDLVSFSFNGKISCRLFAQEIIGKLLTELTLWCNLRKYNTKMKRILLAVVLSRCTDRSVLVRGRAMATFALFSKCDNNADKDIFEDMFKAANANKQFFTLDDLMDVLVKSTNPLPGSDALIAMLLNRVNDERASVRQSSLKILRNLTFMFPSLVECTMNAIIERCQDSMLMVRQFAVHVFSEILKQFPHDSNLLHGWVQAVMPQIYDVENKVQDKVLECLQDVLIDRITRASAYKPSDAYSLPWRLLDKLSNMRMRKHLSKACSLWVKNGTITNLMITNLQSHVGTDNTIGAWILLAALAENMKIPRMEVYLADYKDVICKNDYHASLVLHVIRHAYSCLNEDCLENLYQHLYRRICHFEIKFNLISVCLDIINNVSRHLHADNRVSMEEHMVELIKLSEAELQDMYKDDEDDTQDALKIRAIFTLGHASLLCTNKISSSSLQILQKLLLKPESLPQAMGEMKGLQTSAVVLLCQQALRDRDIAKKIMPIFGKLMRQETDSPEGIAVKVNAAKALADICVRFTALVEPYLPDMCISMKDPNPVVREAIVVIFIQLLLEDFIKIKGPFFFHILTMLSDSDNMIRELTVFLVEERLLRKNKTLISQQFLKSIYHYNNYPSQNALCGYKMHDKEKKLLTLPGEANREKRNIIYVFMLDHLEPVARLQLIVKLTKYILCEICDGTSIDVKKDEGACILRDTLSIMSNDRLYLSLKKRTDNSSELDEVTNSLSTLTDINKFTLELKIYRLNNVLPTLIRLKEKLNALKSPLKYNVDKLLYRICSTCNKDNLLNLLNEYPEFENDMERYQRKSKDKITSESDDDIDDCSPPMISTINHKDSLLNVCKRTPTRASHSPIPSTSQDDTNGRLNPTRAPYSPIPSTSRDNTNGRLSPIRALHLSVPSTSRNDANDRLSPNNCPQILQPHVKLIKNISALEKLSPEFSFNTSTPRVRNLHAGISCSSTCVLQIKRPSSQLEMSSVSPPHKISRKSMSRS